MQVIARANHTLSRSQISPNALKVLYRLHNAGFKAFLVGGGVRDLLLEQTPKDFDLATDASPTQIKKLFRNCRLIGRRFRLAHIYFANEIVEVATFRAKEGATHTTAGMIVRDNIYGTQEEDAFRRDFTINALYYDISNFSIVDYTQGIKDLENKTVRVIGDPALRYQEDPIRMLRALRLATKLGLSLETKTASEILTQSHLLKEVPQARLADEVAKWFFSGKSAAIFKVFKKFNIFELLFNQTANCLKQNKKAEEFLIKSFANTDQRIADNKIINPAFLFAVVLWPPLQHLVQTEKKRGTKPALALKTASNEITRKQSKAVTLLRRHVHTMNEIWTLQYKMQRQIHKKKHLVINHPRFKAAYDFMEIRAAAGENLKKQLDYWGQFIQ